MTSSSLFAELTAPNGVKYTQPLGLFINNEFVPARFGQLLTTINPADETEITQVHAAGAKDVDAAVQAARNAFNGPWGGLTSTQRGRLLSHLADRVEANAKTLATVEAWDSGKPYQVCLEGDIQEVVSVLRYYAGYADKVHGQVIETEKNQHVFTTREPIGVCGQIIPWNYPLSMAAWKLGPAVAAGNCVVIKAAEQTPLSILYLATLVKEAGYPKGVINIINGYGKDAGAALASHMDVDKIAFTGSTETGRQIMKLASVNLKSITLETGGKSPLVVFEDADLDKAVYWGHIGIMSNAGQVCTANSRVFVHENIYDAFVDRFLKQVASAKIGDPFAADTFQGPQVNKTQRDRVLQYIELGKSEGATLATGGKARGSPSDGKGYFIEPTVFTDVKDDMTIYREEIFGPVAAVLSFKTEEEVVARANDTLFGLGAAVFTKDVSRIHRITRKIQSGTVWVNSSNNSDIRAPFGGFKQSGIGRECGQAGIEAYTNTKTVYISLE
ncbi:aldehyde dehydrogenase domain-containing protein [Dactylonectria estremocensis]|uniref:aldehyde dehydrogenase (NAD(+)) n=1 Tax=Dactylonectria estremocensis TaxID=1079267 RepID=A0A9P9J7S1_9HYPO|nr:aldehyde dehydrogenase domain-containing protein [Dactylonectria estremocensis]